MKYIKKYEFDSFGFSKDDSIEDQIKHFVDDITYPDESFELDIPLTTEIAILHQQDFISEIYYNMVADSYYVIDVTLDEFEKIYNDLLVDSSEKLMDYYGTTDVSDLLKNVSKYNI